MPVAAGVLLQAKSTGRYLFLRRPSGIWETPGGHIERGETAEQAAWRELREEVGPLSFTMCRPLKIDSFYVLFYGQVSRQFTPILTEHVDFTWACPEAPPDPLHRGLADVL